MQALAYRENPKETPVRHLRIYTPIKARAKNKARHNFRVMIICAFIIATTLALLYAFENVKGQAYQQEASAYKVQLLKYSHDYSLIGSEVDMLLNMNRLEETARQMGMVYPDKVIVIDLSNDKLCVNTK